MDKESSFTEVDYTVDHHYIQHQQDEVMKPRIGVAFGDSNPGTIDYTLNIPQHNQHITSRAGFSGIPTSLEKLSFADVMQFADLGPKSPLNQAKISEEETGIDPVYFLKFPVLSDKVEGQSLMVPQPGGENEHGSFKGVSVAEDSAWIAQEERAIGEDDEARSSDNPLVQNQFLGDDQDLHFGNPAAEAKNKRKRTRSVKTNEEVESQRMTHIAVERSRRKQMNEHLRVLRSLMPGSYVQRGDQASIIGGAIEFVRELEQLLQCLESQKRRRLMGDSFSLPTQQPDHEPPLFPTVLPHDQMNLMDFETGLHEERAENKSYLADVEVKLLGFDAMIKILCRRRPGQLTKTIAALEDLQLNILHTNITTIEQTVLYSFNVKVESESSFTAEDIATSVQQIFSYIHANSSI